MPETKIPAEELLRLATEHYEARQKARTLPQAPQRSRPVPVPVAEVSGFLTLSEPYDWPGRGTVYVHPSSLEDTWWAGEQAALAINQHAEARKEKLTTQQFEYRMQFFVRPFSVVAVCRTGPAPDAPQAFSAADADAFRTNPAYRRAVGQVLAVSERLGGEDFLRSAYDALFFKIEERLGTCASALREGSDWKTCAANLEALAAFVSLTRQRSTLSDAGFPEWVEEEESEAAPELVSAGWPPEA
jgi:hypothetical protein